MFLLFFFLIVGGIQSNIFAEDGPEEKQDMITQTIRSLGPLYKDAIVEFNLRIQVPEIQGLEPVDLWATLVRHSGDQKLPTIIVATPYRREIIGSLMQLPLFTMGYNILCVDVRGTGSSEGKWVSFGPEEHTDYAYVIDHWVPKHDWSDGQVGLFGGSYMAISQMMAAGQIECDEVTGKPVHLKAMFAMAPMADAYRDIVMHGGNLDLAFIPMWLGGVDMLAMLPSTLYIGGENEGLDTPSGETEIMKEVGANWMNSWDQFPEHLAWFTDSFKMVDGEFYDERSTMIYWPDKHPDGRTTFGTEKTISPDIPTFIVAGWFDIFTRGSLNAYHWGLKNHDVKDKGLVIGPWYHTGSAGSTPGIPSMGTELVIPARWFDWKIKGFEDPFMVEYPVLIYVMGEDKWRLEKEWPLPESRVTQTTLYLSKKKAYYNWKDWFSFFNYRKNYRLVEKTGKSDFRPKDPLLIHNPAELHGAMSRSAVRWTAGALSLLSQDSKYNWGQDIDYMMPWEDERLDEVATLTFTTKKLEEDLDITGPMTLSFWAKTTFKEPVSHSVLDDLQDSMYKDIMQLELEDDNNFVKLMMDQKEVQWVLEVNDVFPLGRAKNVASGWLRSSHRPYDPNESEGAKEHAVDPDYTPFNPFYDRPDRHPKLIKEGELYEYVVEIFPTSNIFKKGHKIRVSISASDFPHLVPIMVPSENTIVIDADHPATLTFSSAHLEKDKGETWEWIDDLDEYPDVDTYLIEHEN